MKQRYDHEKRPSSMKTPYITGVSLGIKKVLNPFFMSNYTPVRRRMHPDPDVSMNKPCFGSMIHLQPICRSYYRCNKRQKYRVHTFCIVIISKRIKSYHFFLRFQNVFVSLRIKSYQNGQRSI